METITEFRSPASDTQAPTPARRHPWQVIRRVLLIALILLTGWVGGDLAYVSVGAEIDHATQADVILVLGCRVYSSGGVSPCIRARAGHAADLYKRGLAEWVLATGGPTSQGPVESLVLRRVLQEAGVPDEAIVEESRSHNTIQNIHYSREIMQARGWDDAILVTEPFHINRAALIARDANLTVYPSPALDTPSWRWPTPRIPNLARDALSLMLYQAKRVVGISQ